MLAYDDWAITSKCRRLEAAHRTDLEAQGPTELRALIAEYQKIYDSCEPYDARYLQFFRGHLMYLLPGEEHLIKGGLDPGAHLYGYYA
jgi:hypothetical protein